MCGRYNVVDSPGLQALLRDLGIDLQLPNAINIAPTENVSLIRRDEQHTEMSSARWWLIPSFAKSIDQKYAMFNARSETLSERAAFKKPFLRQRGILPMSSFIEWRVEAGVKQPYLVSNDAKAIAAAALWDVWMGGEQPLLTCTVVTTAAAPQFAPWHSRMPVMLEPQEYNRWLDNTRPIDAADPIFRNALKKPLQLSPVDRAIGNARNKSDTLLQSGAEIVVLKP